MEFSDLINAFGKHVGAEPEIQDGTVAFTIDDMPVVMLDTPELDSIILSGEIAEPPPQGLELLYKTILEANYNFSATNGATLSINRETGHIVICRLISTSSTDETKFINAIESFVNIMEAWKNIILNYRENQSSSAGKNADSNEEASLDDLNDTGEILKV